MHPVLLWFMYMVAVTVTYMAYLGALNSCEMQITS